MGVGSGYSFAPSGKKGDGKGESNVQSVIVEVGWGRAIAKLNVKLLQLVYQNMYWTHLNNL